MSRCLRTFAIVALISLSGCGRRSEGAAAAAERQSELVVYRFPFKAETLFPVTAETIVDRGARCAIHKQGAIEEMVAVLRGAPAGPDASAFTNRNVRLLMVRDGKPLAAVEKEGAVRMDGGVRVLSSQMLEQLIGLVKASCS